MAGTTQTVLAEFHKDSMVDKMREEHNKMVVDIERLRAALDAVCDILDADAGVSATNLASTANVATAATMTAAAIDTHSPTN